MCLFYSIFLAAVSVLRPIAQFIGVPEASAVHAAATEAVRPEQFVYNQEANALSQKANGGNTVAETLPALFFCLFL